MNTRLNNPFGVKIPAGFMTVGSWTTINHHEDPNKSNTPDETAYQEGYLRCTHHQGPKSVEFSLFADADHASGKKSELFVQFVFDSEEQAKAYSAYLHNAYLYKFYQKKSNNPPAIRDAKEIHSDLQGKYFFRIHASAYQDARATDPKKSGLIFAGKEPLPPLEVLSPYQSTQKIPGVVVSRKNVWEYAAILNLSQTINVQLYSAQNDKNDDFAQFIFDSEKDAEIVKSYLYNRYGAKLTKIPDICDGAVQTNHEAFKGKFAFRMHTNAYADVVSNFGLPALKQLRPLNSIPQLKPLPSLPSLHSIPQLKPLRSMAMPEVAYDITIDGTGMSIANNNNNNNNNNNVQSSVISSTPSQPKFELHKITQKSNVTNNSQDFVRFSFNTKNEAASYCNTLWAKYEIALGNQPIIYDDNGKSCFRIHHSAYGKIATNESLTPYDQVQSVVNMSVISNNNNASSVASSAVPFDQSKLAHPLCKKGEFVYFVFDKEQDASTASNHFHVTYLRSNGYVSPQVYDANNEKTYSNIKDTSVREAFKNTFKDKFIIRIHTKSYDAIAKQENLQAFDQLSEMDSGLNNKNNNSQVLIPEEELQSQAPISLSASTVAKQAAQTKEEAEILQQIEVAKQQLEKMKEEEAKTKQKLEKLKKEEAEKARLAKEEAAKRQQEMERLKKEEAEKARLAKEEAAKRQQEMEKIKKEEAEKARLAKEEAAKRQQEMERLKKEEAEKARLAKEEAAKRQQEMEKIKKEEAEKARLAKEEAAKLSANNNNNGGLLSTFDSINNQPITQKPFRKGQAVYFIFESSDAAVNYILWLKDKHPVAMWQEGTQDRLSELNNSYPAAIGQLYYARIPESAYSNIIFFQSLNKTLEQSNKLLPLEELPSLDDAIYKEYKEKFEDYISQKRALPKTFTVEEKTAYTQLFLAKAERVLNRAIAANEELAGLESVVTLLQRGLDSNDKVYGKLFYVPTGGLFSKSSGSRSIIEKQISTYQAQIKEIKALAQQEAAKEAEKARLVKEEAAQKAKEEAAQKAKEEAAQKAKEEAEKERLAQEEAKQQQSLSNNNNNNIMSNSTNLMHAVLEVDNDAIVAAPVPELSIEEEFDSYLTRARELPAKFTAEKQLAFAKIVVDQSSGLLARATTTDDQKYEALGVALEFLKKSLNKDEAYGRIFAVPTTAILKPAGIALIEKEINTMEKMVEISKGSRVDYTIGKENDLINDKFFDL